MHPLQVLSADNTGHIKLLESLNNFQDIIWQFSEATCVFVSKAFVILFVDINFPVLNFVV